jgi:hypothetical protein
MIAPFAEPCGRRNYDSDDRERLFIEAVCAFVGTAPARMLAAQARDVYGAGTAYACPAPFFMRAAAHLARRL